MPGIYRSSSPWSTSFQTESASLCEHEPQNSVKEKDAASVYLKALGDLARSSCLANFGFYGWLCRFSNDYGDLLSRKDPYALIIFGYSCVTLKHAGPV